MNMKISTFVILTIVIALVMTGFGIIMSDTNDKYTTGYSEDDYVSYQKLSELRNLTQEIKQDTGYGENTSVDRSVADLFGNFLADAKNTLLISAKSFDIFETMTDEGFNQIGITNPFRVAFYAVIMVVVFLGILAIIIGRQV